MTEKLLVRNGAPTLAGMKTGSLFTCPYQSREEIQGDIRELNRRLVPKGILECYHKSTVKNARK